VTPTRTEASGGAADPELSIVTTLYRSQAYLAEFYRRMVAAAEAVTPSFEIVFVDDGSPDQVADQARELARRDRRVSLVALSRNFGHHQAAVAGL
jgi:putative glycosyltransferase